MGKGAGVLIMALHPDDLQMCRICLDDPVDSYGGKPIKLIPVFSPENGADTLNKKIFKVFEIKIEKNDIKPKLICERCHAFILQVYEQRKVAADSQIVINFIVAKKTRHHQNKEEENSLGTENNNKKLKKDAPEKMEKTRKAKKAENGKKLTPEFAVPKCPKNSTMKLPKRSKQDMKKLNSEIQRRFKSMTDFLESQCPKE
ncbi:Zinc finger, AD-type [Cinara cedri]|uniref:Zinc finger, AD-type n=1 Tax=Cinara cedri TaxID=506608 RepID=A0A5E4MW63_9HEMI|nr:Zinc finger, AD-type [Cinara cedri]